MVVDSKPGNLRSNLPRNCMDGTQGGEGDTSPATHANPSARMETGAHWRTGNIPQKFGEGFPTMVMENDGKGLLNSMDVESRLCRLGSGCRT
jgi:hypothetical protein